MKRLTRKKCFYCEQPLGFYITRDHVIPKSKGGINMISRTNVTNIVLCCKKCNNLKAHHSPSEFFDLIVEGKINEYDNRTSKIVLKNLGRLIENITEKPFLFYA